MAVARQGGPAPCRRRFPRQRRNTRTLFSASVRVSAPRTGTARGISRARSASVGPGPRRRSPVWPLARAHLSSDTGARDLVRLGVRAPTRSVEIREIFMAIARGHDRTSSRRRHLDGDLGSVSASGSMLTGRVGEELHVVLLSAVMYMPLARRTPGRVPRILQARAGSCRGRGAVRPATRPSASPGAHHHHAEVDAPVDEAPRRWRA